ncbi:MAG: triose-phosphate isomerase [Helicobacteraceae bacterium]|jgi:triosephosphate isomerase|nr:triose-phosphate isomerase [Helicobacteraceae bacterium]
MIVAANLKTNHTRVSVQGYLDAVGGYIAQNDITDRAVVFPPATALCASRGNITVGAQNAWPAENGSFTGEIGSEQLDEFAVRAILIGHSERRHILGEGLDLVKRKFEYFAGLDYEIFFCVGEPLEIKEAGFDAVMTYIERQLDGIDLSYPRLVLAYEPVWAIGTGKAATGDDILSVHSAIKNICDKPLLYGGSVKVDNAEAILSLDNVDGALVGTASWISERFCALLDIADKIKKGQERQ